MDNEYRDEIGRVIYVLEVQSSLSRPEAYWAVYDSNAKAEKEGAKLLRDGRIVNYVVYEDEVQ